MFQISAHDDFVVYSIGNKDGSVQACFVPELGGVMSSLICLGQDGPRELLYHNDFFWQRNNDDLAGGMPFLFPLCARLSRNNQLGVYSYNGQYYELPIHGFSWQLPWEVLEHSEGLLVMQLQFNESTLKQFPFDFAVTLEYQIEDQQLFCHQTYENKGGEAMPYYAGFHPYFLVEESKDLIKINYEPIERWQYNRSLTDLVGRLPVFDLPSTLSNADLNEQLTRVADNKTVIMTYPNGDILEVEAQGVENPDLFPFVQLYTKPGKPFFCIEPWMGYPNALNAMKGVRWLAAGQAERGLLRISLGK